MRRATHENCFNAFAGLPDADAFRVPSGAGKRGWAW